MRVQIWEHAVSEEEDQPCPECKGEGWDEDDAPCPTCGGEGYV